MHPFPGPHFLFCVVLAVLFNATKIRPVVLSLLMVNLNWVDGHKEA